LVVSNLFSSRVPTLQISLIIVILLTLLYIRRLVIEYRILKGYFGTNRHEAGEIIRFIQKNSDDINSSGGNQGQRRRVFPEEVLEEIQSEIGAQGLGETI